MTTVRDLKPEIAKGGDHLRRMIDEAVVIADQWQAEGTPQLAALKVGRRVKAAAAAAPKSSRAAPTAVEIRGGDGQAILSYVAPNRRSGLATTIPAKPTVSEEEMKAALSTTRRRVWLMRDRRRSWLMPTN